MPPGRSIVLLTEHADAVWGVNIQEFVMHAWPGAFNNTIFRNESKVLSSILIREAVAATVALLGPLPKAGLITMIDTKKVNSKNPGYCYQCAGWEKLGVTKGGLIVFGIFEAEPEPPIYYQVPMAI